MLDEMREPLAPRRVVRGAHPVTDDDGDVVERRIGGEEDAEPVGQPVLFDVRRLGAGGSAECEKERSDDGDDDEARAHGCPSAREGRAVGIVGASRALVKERRGAVTQAMLRG
jgi:hypothetical protein